LSLQEQAAGDKSCKNYRCAHCILVVKGFFDAPATARPE
jgi:hypothetical protein